MEYVVCNNRGVFIRLQSGKPVTCGEKDKQLFDKQKALNVARYLPRTLKRFHFSVQPAPALIDKGNNKQKDFCVTKPQSIHKPYIIPAQVQSWVDRVKDCNGLALDAAKRQVVLSHDLSNIDRELSNLLHEIELSYNKNAAEGYKSYKKAKDILERRRIIKDELSVVSSILECNLSNMAANRIQKVVDNLANRKFIFREIEVDSNEYT